MPDVEKDAPTCRACYAASLTDDERERFNAEPVTSCVYLCPDHEAAIAEALARFPMPTFVRARQARTTPYVTSPDERSSAGSGHDHMTDAEIQARYQATRDTSPVRPTP